MWVGLCKGGGRKMGWLKGGNMSGESIWWVSEGGVEGVMGKMRLLRWGCGGGGDG